MAPAVATKPRTYASAMRSYHTTLRSLSVKPDRLRVAWNHYKTAHEVNMVWMDTSEFTRAVRMATGNTKESAYCSGCSQPEWTTDIVKDRFQYQVCTTCRPLCPTCPSCGEWHIYHRSLTEIDGVEYCPPCIDGKFTWCSHCQVYFPDENDIDHEHSSVECACDPMPHQFVIPANSHGTIKEDERLFVELPAGFISDEAIEAVLHLLWYNQFQQQFINAVRPEERAKRVEYPALETAVNSLERVWQAKRGNFTRRLSKVLHDEFGAKLDPGLLSKCGAAIRERTGDINAWHVEFTRDLNKPAAHFANEDSCWWGGEYQSLCALKHWGGLAMRSYASAEQDRRRPSGRAWVQPLNENLEPISDILGAPAYIVYNCYDDLGGYTAARILAYLTSRTYKKVGLSIEYQYVNSGSGYLVCDQEMANRVTHVDIEGLGSHTAVAA